MSSEWDIEEALAWVIWRDLRVVEVMPSDNLAAMFLHPPDKEGYGTLRFGGNPIPRQGEIAQMLEALRMGHIKARGRKSGEGDRAYITPEQWRDLIIRPSVFNGTQAVPEDGVGKGASWKDLMFSIAELQGYFPAPGKKRRTKTKSKNDGAIDDDALLVRMRAILSEKPCSVLAAAEEVSHQAIGQSPVAIIARLRRKYRDKYPRS